jgi:hypothetical protein
MVEVVELAAPAPRAYRSISGAPLCTVPFSDDKLLKRPLWRLNKYPTWIGLRDR